MLFVNLSKRVNEVGLLLVFYYSHALDWRDGGDSGMKEFCNDETPKQAMFVNDFDPAAVTFSDYINQKSLPQVKELVSNYKLSEYLARHADLYSSGF